MPLSQCMYLGGGTEARIYPTTLADSKWHPVPLKRDGCLIPNLIGTYLCGAKKWKENMLQNIRLQRNRRQSPWSDNNMNDSDNSCVKIILRRLRTWNKLYTSLLIFCFTYNQENFEMCGVLNANYRLWATMGPLETFGNRVVVGWRFRFRCG